MLEKIGLPSKPSLRGNNWVIDATHCQGCSSQFTFINRKHHCRRCGGLFCGSCTQQRMYLRGQGESPVRICEPCKTLEEAARFEMRHGHKNKSRKGVSKHASDNEDDVLTKVLGDGGNESFSSDKESVHSLKRATTASCSNNDMEFDLESTTPEELRQLAVEEKKKYKVLKAEGKPEEALRAFKRGKELERQAGTLEIELRKNRRKAVSLSSTNESTKGGIRKQPKEKDDLVSELRELGWSDLDLHDADKKPVNMTLEGELTTLLKEVSPKTTNPEKGSFGIEKSEVVAIKKKALALKREGKLTEAKEELKRAKILEKQIEERELLGDDEDSDDEFTSLVRSMGIDKHDVLATGNDRGQDRNFDFDNLLRIDDVPNLDGNFDVTEEDMDDPEISAALQSLGWTEDHSVDDKDDKEARLSQIRSLKLEALNEKRAGNTKEAMALLKKAKLLESDQEKENDGLHQDSVAEPLKLDSDRKKTAPKSKLAIQRELLALKKKALALRREGKTDEAERELLNGKALEQQLEEMENGQKVKPAATKPMDVEDEDEDVNDTDMNDPSYLSMLQNLGWKDENDGKAPEPEPEPEPQKRKSKTEIQRELLGLKRKSLALRRQGDLNEAEEVLEKTKILETQLAEMDIDKNEGGETVVSDVFISEKPQTSTVSVFVDEPGSGSGSVQQRILAHKRKAVSLKREGRLAEAKEELKQAKLLENPNPNSEMGDRTPVPNTSKPTGSEADGSLANRTPVPSTSKPTGSEADGSLANRTPVPSTSKPTGSEADGSPAKLSSRDRFKIQQESLSHKRLALKLRREGRTEEADAEFELAKNLESQLEAANESTKPAGPVDDVIIDDLLDPQLLSALREVGIESSSPEKGKPVVVVNKIPAESAVVVNKIPAVVNKPETANEDRTELEERIKAEKVKAVKLKRAGKQAEALDALRRAKLLEKKLISLA